MPRAARRPVRMSRAILAAGVLGTVARLLLDLSWITTVLLSYGVLIVGLGVEFVLVRRIAAGDTQ